MKKITSIGLIIASIVGYAAIVFAVPLPNGTLPPVGGYSAGDSILDPGCAPGSSDCFQNIGLISAINGLNATGTKVGLGGVLNQDTSLDRAGHNFSITNGNSSIVAFNSPGLEFTGITDRDMSLDSATVGVLNQSGRKSAFISYNNTFTGNNVGFNVNEDVISMSLHNNAYASPNHQVSIFLAQNMGAIQMMGYTNTSAFNTVWQNTDPSDLTGNTHADLAFITNDGQWGWAAYPASRNDTGVSTPINFLYTDSNGKVLSAPITSLIPSTSPSIIGSTSGITNNVAPGLTHETWVGFGAGDGGASNSYTTFIGESAGYGATSASGATFVGAGAGYNSDAAARSVFIGPNAGIFATNAYDSIFLGALSGRGATNASNSNFFGKNAGWTAGNANNSNFFGQNAGYGATNANNAIFIGNSAGASDSVNNASGGTSILIGDNTSTGGYSNSIAIGKGAVNTMANQFMVSSSYNNWNIGGVNYVLPSAQATAAGQVLSNDGSGVLSWSTLGGSGGPKWYAENATAPSSLPTATGAGSIAIGNGAQAIDANLLTFGYFAGNGSSGNDNANLIGTNSGASATSNISSNFLGAYSGYQATSSFGANFLGPNTGSSAASAYRSNFIGSYAGSLTTNANDSNFFGDRAGSNTSASYANFFGSRAGENATNARRSFFVGSFAGYGATNANNAIFIGNSAGASDSVNNASGGTSILIGDNTSTGGYSNSIAIGKSAVNTAINQLMVGSSTSPINTSRINGAGGTQCTITTGTGIACSSDIRLKTNILDLSDTLDSLMKVRTVTYNWLQNPNGKQQVGFLAQDLEQYFPQLVETDDTGMKSVYYAQMTPILVESLRELNIKLSNIQKVSDSVDKNFVSSLVSWLGNAKNGIGDLFAGTIHAQNQLCVGDTCITQQEFLDMVQKAKNSESVSKATISNNQPQGDSSTVSPVILASSSSATVSQSSSEATPTQLVTTTDSIVIPLLTSADQNVISTTDSSSTSE